MATTFTGKTYRYVREGRQEEALRAVLSFLDVKWNDDGRNENLTIPCPCSSCESHGKPVFQNGVSTNLSKGLVNCFHCGKGYNPVSYMETVTGKPKKEVLSILDNLLGYSKGSVAKFVYVPKKTPSQESCPIADADTLNKVYGTLIRLSISVSIAEIDMLKSRGFEPRDILNLGYRCYPASEEASKALVKAIRDELPGVEFAGIPGFYKDYHGEWALAAGKEHSVLMPCRDRHNRVVGLHRRRADDEISDNKPKIVWVSSTGLEGGTKAQAAPGYSCEWETRADGLQYPIIKDGILTITEGYMKADLAHICRPDKAFLAVPGVTITSRLPEEFRWLKENCGLQKVVTAFDADYKTNPSVQQALAKLEQMVRDAGLILQRASWQEKAANGEYLKGIDDSLLYSTKKILPSAHSAKAIMSMQEKHLEECVLAAPRSKAVDVARLRKFHQNQAKYEVYCNLIEMGISEEVAEKATGLTKAQRKALK